ncbi:hypothetical protein IWQ62_005612 [Dispira parvispora]|uniref:RGS domain-containing protein n=1 Tax=Dispira parvispora TaxID=1520584 RepID=A0A9W8DZG4_9FUNG|nr:hypothetical protein IWQ62_005612 [Dispira parvispora]
MSSSVDTLSAQRVDADGNVLDDPLSPQVETFILVFYFTLGAVFTLYIAITTFLFYRLGLNIREVQLRSRGLVLLQSATLLILTLLTSTYSALSFRGYPCFLHWWGFHLCIVLTSYAITARSLRYFYLVHMNWAKCHARLKTTADLDMVTLLHNQSNGSPLGNVSITDKRFRVDLHDGMKNVAPTRGFLGSLVRKYPGFFSNDYALSRVFMVLGSGVLLYVIFVQIFSPNFSLSPLATRCQFDWSYYVILIWLGLHVVVVYPVLVYHLWGLKDAYGIYQDLLVTSIAVTVGTVIFIIWTFVPTLWLRVFSTNMWLFITVQVMHTSSVTLPVLRALRSRRRPTAYVNQQRQQRLNSSLENRPKEAVKDFPMYTIGADWDSQFIQLVDDPAGRSTLKNWASEYFCMELVLFLEEFQELKEFVEGMYSLPQDATTVASPNAFAGSQSHPLHRPSANIQDTWEYYEKHHAESKETSFVTQSLVVEGASLKLAYVMFYQRFLDPASDMCVPISPITLAGLAKRLGASQCPITVFDDVHRDVMMLLYSDVYLKRHKNQ